jgi:hypothetical protein
MSCDTNDNVCCNESGGMSCDTNDNVCRDLQN